MAHFDGQRCTHPAMPGALPDIATRAVPVVSMNECARCTQARELVKARRRIRQLERKVEKLKRVLERAMQVCLMLIASADQVLAQKSGVPRGTWAYAKGVKHAAAAIYRVLQME